MRQASESYKLRDAASTILLRENGDGFEVLLLKRSPELSFGPDFWVFPGGKVDTKDGDDPDYRFKNSAVRETAEEAGLSITPEQMAYVMSITTPSGPVRFNTRFYAAKITKEQPVRVDGSEIVDYQWIKPAKALAEFEALRIQLMVPTGLILMRLALHDSMESAYQRLTKPPHFDLKPVLLVFEDGQQASIYPGDHAFPGVPATGESLHRCVFTSSKSHWEYLHNCDAEMFPPLDGGYNRHQAGRSGPDIA